MGLNMSTFKQLTILHSNDMHGDFLAESTDSKLIGGVALLSGYLNKIRQEVPHVLYAISGDMFRGSIIDSEFKGVSTVDIMNMLAPDIVTLGNHELDYGLPHLLFLEKCTKFPIINANLYIKMNNSRLFNSHKIFHINGMNILFIGIVTEEVIAATKSEGVIGTLIDVDDAVEEIGKICNTYKTTDIDLTVLLTHIGFEADKVLAAKLDTQWGVDIIIGGHSHTFLDKPECINDILIVQAGTGTDIIGRFDITIDTDKNTVAEYKWETVPIDDKHCPKDEEIEKIIHTYKTQTDTKYGRIITKFIKQLTHPRRQQETSLGNLFADAMSESLGVDIAFMASGSIRGTKLGPVVDLKSLMEIFPYDDAMHMFKWSGKSLRKAIKYLLRDDFLDNETEFYQVPKGVKVTYDFNTKELISLNVNDQPVTDDKIYTIAIQNYHANNIASFFGLSDEEAFEFGDKKCVSTSCFDIIEEYLMTHQHLDRVIEGRIDILNRPY